MAEELKPILVSPDKIRRNDRNPRRKFPQPSLDRLADSIEKIGVLVPVTVYRDPKGSTDYVLLYPGLTASANAVANDVLPSIYQVSVTAGGATVTYSLGVNLLV